MSQLLRIAGIPCGLVAARDADAGPQYYFPPIDTTVGDALDRAVHTDDLYAWTEIDGVINLAPRRTTPPVLDCVVAEYSADLLWADHVMKVAAAPEVARCAAEAGLRAPMGYAGSRPGRSDEPTIPLRRVSVRMQDVLNDVVRESGHGQWWYQEWTEHGQTLYFISHH